MSPWSVVRLGDVVEIFDYKRVPLSAAQRRTRQGQYPYYGAQGVIDYIDDYVFDGRYILVPEDGENLRSRKLPIAYFATGKFWVNNHAHILRGITGVSVDRFIQSAIEGMSISSWITGAAQPKLSQGNLVQIPILLPPHSEQVVIASILDAIDQLIENNRRRVEVLEEMARAIYREWFVHFRYPGLETTATLGDLPAGWSWGTIGNLVDLGKDTVDPATLDPKTPAVGLEHIPRRKIVLDDWTTAETVGSRKSRFCRGDLLFGKIRPYFHKVSVAPIDGICSTDAIVIRPKPKHWGEAVAVAVSDEFVANAVQTSNGTKMPRADWNVIREWPVPIPTPDVSANFTDVMQGHLRLAETLMFTSRLLASVRDLLLPRLVSGEIDVSSLDLGALVEGSVA
jgi:type I restriction enzyme S subunit